MKITIFGAGAIGSHLAARLGAGGADIAAVARGAQLDAIVEHGITLLLGEQRITARIRATDRPQTLGRQDVVIVTMKAPTLPGIAPLLLPLLGPETIIVFAMNGIPWWYLYAIAEHGRGRPDLSRLDPDGVLAQSLGHERVLGCVIASANEIVSPGVVRNAPGTRNRFTLGEPDGSISRRAQAVAGELERAGIIAPVTPDIRGEIWDKLVRNLSTAPICALTGEPIGVLGRHDELFDVAKGLMREGLAVAAAHGVRLDLTVEAAYGTRPNSPHKSSMLQDFERGRVPEIDGLLTSVQEFARVVAVPTPYLDTVTALVIEKARKAGLYPV